MTNQDKETIVLLPCPVCGEIPNTKTESLNEHYAYARKVQFKCEKCGISAGAVGDQSKGGYADNSKVDENALANWNTKANSPVIAKSTARIAELEDLLLATLHEADCRQCKRFSSSGLCNSITVCENGNRFISAPFFLLYKINEVAFNG